MRLRGGRGAENAQKGVAGDKRESGGDHHLRPARRDGQAAYVESRRAGREFVADEFIGGVEEQAGSGHHENAGENFKRAVQLFRRELDESLQREVAGIARGQGGPGEAGPQHHMPEQGVEPDYAGVKEDAQQHLHEGKPYQSEDQGHDEGFFGFNYVILYGKHKTHISIILNARPRPQVRCQEGAEAGIFVSLSQARSADDLVGTEDKMRISRKMEEAINRQVNAELYSAYLYLGMSACCTEMNLKGIANWLYVQAQEEMTHAMKFYRFILERGGHARLPAIEGVRDDWKTPLEMFDAAFNHEQRVTLMINNLVDIAVAERDHATASMLNWFVDEQVEEEANSSEIAVKLKLIGESKEGLFMLDKDLAVRVFVDSTQPAGGAQP